MTSYSFRLKFRTATRFDCHGERPAVTLAGIGHPIELTTSQGVESNWVYAKSSGYGSEKDAQEAGDRVRQALLIAGIRHRFGAECDDRQGQSISMEIAKGYKQKTGRILAPERRGLVIFEDGPVDFIGASAHGYTTEHITSLGTYLTSLSPSAVLTEHQRIAAELINDTFLQPSSDAVMILSVTAIEALCPAAARTPFFRGMMSCAIFPAKVILQLLRILRASKYADVTDDLIKVLQGQRERDSIRQGYLRKIRALLGGPIAKEFDRFYERRSKFVHDGYGRGTFVTDSYRVRDIAIQLLDADLSSQNTL